MAEEVGRPGGSPEHEDGEPRAPAPTIWPVGFAAGVALVLIGLVVNWTVVAVGAGLAIVFGFLWARDVTREVRRAPAPPPPPPAPVSELALPEEEAEEPPRFPRSRFLEGATLGLGGLIGAMVTAPVAIFAVAPAFVDQGYDDIDLGPLENFPEGQFVIVKFQSEKGEGLVARRTAYVRNNGVVNGNPSFTILWNRCAHMGCPVQPQGPSQDANAKDVETDRGLVSITPTQPSGFGCPCHGGAYDNEGNRTAGPPVRALDRFKYKIVDGRLVLADPYSVGHVDGEGAEARIHAYALADPGQHVDGPEQFFYPYVP